MVDDPKKRVPFVQSDDARSSRPKTQGLQPSPGDAIPEAAEDAPSAPILIDQPTYSALVRRDDAARMQDEERPPRPRTTTQGAYEDLRREVRDLSTREANDTLSLAQRVMKLETQWELGPGKVDELELKLLGDGTDKNPGKIAELTSATKNFTRWMKRGLFAVAGSSIGIAVVLIGYGDRTGETRVKTDVAVSGLSETKAEITLLRGELATVREELLRVLSRLPAAPPEKDR